MKLGKLLHLSELQFNHLWNRNKNFQKFYISIRNAVSIIFHFLMYTVVVKCFRCLVYLSSTYFLTWIIKGKDRSDISSLNTMAQFAFINEGKVMQLQLQSWKTLINKHCLIVLKKWQSFLVSAWNNSLIRNSVIKIEKKSLVQTILKKLRQSNDLKLKL